MGFLWAWVEMFRRMWLLLKENVINRWLLGHWILDWVGSTSVSTKRKSGRLGFQEHRSTPVTMRDSGAAKWRWVHPMVK